MSTDPLGNRAAESSASGRIDSTGLPPSTAASGVTGVGVPAVEVDVAEVPLRDRIRWGPIIAGVVTAFAVLLFLTVLGLALGISALGGDDDPQTWGTAAGIWGGLSLLVAFFSGGWMLAPARPPFLSRMDHSTGSSPGPRRFCCSSGLPQQRS